MGSPYGLAGRQRHAASCIVLCSLACSIGSRGIVSKAMIHTVGIMDVDE